MEDEIIIWTGKPSWRGYIVFLVILSLITLPGVVILAVSFADKELPVAAAMPNLIIGGLPLIMVILYRMQYDYKVTNKRIITRKGLIGRKISELDINDIRSINVRQGILQRILRLGDIEFTSAAGPIKDVSLHHVNNANYIKERIREYKDKKQV